MPMNLLERLSKQTMPVEMAEPKDVFNLYILQAAGYVIVNIPLPHYSLDGRWHRAPATVRQLTPLGITVLKYLKPTDLTEVGEKTFEAMRKKFRVDSFAFKVPPRGVKVI